MKQRGVFLIGLILIIIYYFLFPRASGKELVIIPDILTNLEPTDFTASPSSLAVRNGDQAGFLDMDHELLSYFSSNRMAVDKHWIAVSGNEGLSLMEPDGRLIVRIPDFAYPIARNGNLFLYRSDTGVLSKINPVNGNLLWRKEYISEITVLEGRQGKTLVGLLDGRVELIDDSGSVILKYRPGGSRVEAIYAGALSGDGLRIALISGLDPQRFILMEERKNGYRPVAHHDTGTDFRRSVSIGFVRNGKQVIYENNGYVDVVDLNSYGFHSLELSGRLVNWIDNLVSDTLLLLGKDGGTVTMKMLSRHDLTLFESTLPNETAEIIMDRNFALITGDSGVAVLEFSVK